MSEPTVNIPLLRKAVEWAEAEAAKPEELSRWYQGSWAVAPETVSRDTACGTCYCIAGYTVALSQTVTPVGDGCDEVTVDGSVVGDRDFKDMAADALGLNHRQAFLLFSGHNTIEDVRRIAEGIAGESL